MSLASIIKKRLRPSGAATNTPQNSRPTPPPPQSQDPLSKRKTSLPLRELEKRLKEESSGGGGGRDALDPLGLFLSGQRLPESSNLCLSLQGILEEERKKRRKSRDDEGETPGALGYFEHYLEVRDAGNLFKFWKGIEDLKECHKVSNSHRDLNGGCETLATSNSNKYHCQEDSDSHVEQFQHHECNSTDSIDSGFEQQFSTSGSSGAHSVPNGAQAREVGAQSGSSKAMMFTIMENNEGPDHQASVASSDSSKHRKDSSKRRHQSSDDPVCQKALELYQRHLAPDCLHPVELPTDVTHRIIQGICTESGGVDAGCFDDAQKTIEATLETDFFPDFLHSEGSAKYSVEVLTSGRVGMADVLLCGSLLTHLLEFLEDSGTGDCHLVEFWVAASHFRASQEREFDEDEDEKKIKSVEEEKQRDAVGIYERFISIQAPASLGISDPMRIEVEEAICSENGVSRSCFDIILALALRALEEKYLTSFLSSSRFRKYLQDLLCQIQTGPYAAAPGSGSSARSGGTPSRRKGRMRRSGSNTSLSTCTSSEGGGLSNHGHPTFSSQSTPLAMSGSKSTELQGKVLRGMGDENMLSLDSIDPDSIWKRRRHAIENIGKIDKLGRYQSSMEQVPGSAPSERVTVGTKLSRAVKKLVSSDITKVQEEMAWQMAEMVVNEVMEVTSPKNQSSATLDENQGNKEGEILTCKSHFSQSASPIHQ